MDSGKAVFCSLYLNSEEVIFMRRVCILLLCVCLFVMPVSAQAAPNTKYVALTFDDGPSGKYTRRLLEGLWERDAHATFFLCGYRMDQYPDLVLQILEEGHEIGCHGATHTSMVNMSRREICAEIVSMQEKLPEDCTTRFFRPPGGFVTEGVQQVAQARQQAIISWSVDPKDWAVKDAAAVERMVLKNVRDGDIILLHDMTDSSVRAALNIVDALERQGYEFVTVSDLAKKRDTRILPGKIYTSFPPKEEAVK